MSSHPLLAGVKAGYNRWSVVYDHDANPLPALEEPLVRHALSDVRNQKVLDLGCGTGRHAMWLAQAGAQVTAVDFSAGMLEEARRKSHGFTIQFIEHDLHQTLPLPDQTFDTIVSGLVLEHLANLEQCFCEINRVLIPGGQAIVTTMHPSMFLRSSQARFTDPASGELVQPGSIPHSISDCLTAALRSGLQLKTISEHAPDVEFVERFPRAAKYLQWPMLLFTHWLRA